MNLHKKNIVNKPKKRRKIRKENTSKDSPYIPVDCVKRKKPYILLEDVETGED